MRHRGQGPFSERMILRYGYSDKTSKSAAHAFVESQLTSAYGEAHLKRLEILLNTALRKSLRVEREPRTLDEEVRAILTEICSHSRKIGFHAEHLIVLAKKAWGDLPETIRQEPERRQEVLERVISECITEYYRTDRNETG